MSGHLRAGLVNELDKVDALFLKGGEAAVDLNEGFIVFRLSFMGL